MRDGYPVQQPQCVMGLCLYEFILDTHPPLPLLLPFLDIENLKVQESSQFRTFHEFAVQIPRSESVTLLLVTTILAL